MPGSISVAMAAELLVQRADPRFTEAGRRVDRLLSQVIDLLWQTHELRLDQPVPADEARAVI